ncbi:hypothetical protein ASG40_11500 [Methylobacterium sp. Leaf399]|uniref:hypothetical protein n=1 Tax=Methylobacterium sp. Leaf399 TaxID=1736364 RepID=UPI0006FACFE3|nr:hypothetical protein [Methylobacterium sp. Leaf399]KQT08499.1 hypothetical protein ASG40_11500 [Methylobacterium sp. Leaf399]
MNAAVLASYVKMSTLVDGTMRIVLDVDPKSAPDAFTLLGSPGTPIAIARITDAAAVAHDRQRHETPDALSGQDGAAGVPAHPSRPAAAPSDRKALPIASKVALRCQDPDFAGFLRTDPSGFAMEWERTKRIVGERSDAETAEAFVKRWCGVERKRDIATDDNALRLWREMDRDFQQWAGSRELARRTGKAA